MKGSLSCLFFFAFFGGARGEKQQAVKKNIRQKNVALGEIPWAFAFPGYFFSPSIEKEVVFFSTAGLSLSHYQTGNTETMPLLGQIVLYFEINKLRTFFAG